MKKVLTYQTRILVAFALAIVSLPWDVGAAVTIVPSQSSVPVGQTSTITVQYRFTGLLTAATGGPYNGPETSTGGTFLTPTSIPLGTVSTTVTATITNGAGQTGESVTVPASVLEAARRQGFNQILLQRIFTGAFNSPVAQVNIAITSEAVGPLRIKRIELYFENRRGEITVKRNQKGLKAFADIRFFGSGLLSGFWEVDGRRIYDVNRQLNFGTNVTLETPDLPNLPTFDTGVHIVRLVITRPAVPIGLPRILYFIPPVEETVRLVKITLAESDGERTGGPTKTFTWTMPHGLKLFLLEFSEEPAGKPIFSAFATGNRYTLPDVGIEGIFSPGKKYYVRIKGYDESENLIGDSDPADFVF
ncbi:MAG: hypothetical protein OEM42_02035 [Deltaproteobacteria bacterium]|nr:hypothetical protein [Deltaproteobacteria bacterium]